MVIPPRDWLLLRGRMRAVAKIPVLPVLLKVATVAHTDGAEETEHAEQVNEPRRDD